MKPRHIAALALASWYLLVPMFDPKSGKVVPLPLPEWNEEGIYDSATECAAARRDLIGDYGRAGASHRVLETLTSQSTCVLSDDARLQGQVPFSLGPPPPTPQPALPLPSSPSVQPPQVR